MTIAPATPSPSTIDPLIAVAVVAAQSEPPETLVSWRRFARQSALWAVIMVFGVASACLLYAAATRAQATKAEPQTETGYLADLSPPH